MKSLLELIKELYGAKAISSTLGTRTNVVRLPGSKLDRYLRESLNIEAASDNAAVNAYKEMEQLVPYVSKMNDSERLIFEGNLGRLRNKLEAADLIPKQKVTKEGEVIGMQSKEKITGEELKKLTEKQGTKYSPTTDIGQLEAAGKRLEKAAEEMSPEFLAKQETDRQAMIARQYEGKGYAGGVFGPSGMYRAVARNFLLDEAAKGKIKLSPDTIKNLQERNYISGGQPLMYADPIRIMRYHYGDDVFEKIPLDKISTGAKSEIIEAMSKVDVPPIKTEAPKTPGGYLTPGEYKANIEEMQNIENMIKRRESRFADMTEEEIQNELQQYGSKRSAFEMGLEYDYPEEYAKYKGPKEPEKKAEGGAMGLDYLTGMEPPKGGYATGGRIGFESGTVPKLLKFLIEKLSTEKLIDKALLERASPKVVQDLYISKYGKLPSAEEVKEMVNKELQGKRSMETFNPKTGEVTTPKEPVKIADKKRQLTKEEIADYEEAIGRDSEQWLFEGTVEEAEKALKKSKAEEAYYYRQYKMGKLDPAPGEQTEARMKFLQKKIEEAQMTGDRRLITPKEVEELMSLEKTFTQSSEQVLENEMNRVLNQYDKSMFIKDAEGRVDISNPANAEKMAMLLKRDHPEIYNKIFNLGEDLSQKQMLSDFDTTGRKPNAKGGRIGYSEGSDGAPSITLDSHDKAPENMDKYPIKAGNLELGISGLLSGRKNYQPDQYNKITGSDRNITVRGKYNVPDTGVSFTGEIGDIRSRSTRNIDVPEFNYKEKIRDVFRANPYSVGIDYNPNPNRNLNLTYDSQGNVVLRGEYKFAKGGLGYLVGE